MSIFAFPAFPQDKSAVRMDAATSATYTAVVGLICHFLWHSDMLMQSVALQCMNIEHLK